MIVASTDHKRPNQSLKHIQLTVSYIIYYFIRKQVCILCVLYHFKVHLIMNAYRAFLVDSLRKRLVLYVFIIWWSHFYGCCYFSMSINLTL